jgi:hypothetical protein
LISLVVTAQWCSRTSGPGGCHTWAERPGLMDCIVGRNFSRKSKMEAINDFLMGGLKRRWWLSTLS